MLDQNKQNNSLNEVNNHNHGFSVSTVSVFKDNSDADYIFKKTEKLVSAIYLISNLISDKEPIKWTLRKDGLELLNSAIKSDFDITVSFQILSLLQVAHISGLISEMNFNILKFEFENLIKNVELEKEKIGLKSPVLSEHFFSIPNNLSSLTDGISKGQNIMSDRFTRPIGNLSDKKKNTNRHSSVGRQDIIVSLLKKNKELGIKDFTVSIKDCSEKTIQRELASLVSKGLIKKEGEKRWSKYSIK